MWSLYTCRTAKISRQVYFCVVRTMPGALYNTEAALFECTTAATGCLWWRLLGEWDIIVFVSLICNFLFRKLSKKQNFILLYFLCWCVGQTACTSRPRRCLKGLVLKLRLICGSTTWLCRNRLFAWVRHQHASVFDLYWSRICICCGTADHHGIVQWLSIHHRALIHTKLLLAILERCWYEPRCSTEFIMMWKESIMFSNSSMHEYYS